MGFVRCDVDLDYDGDVDGPTGPESVPGLGTPGTQLEFTMPVYTATIPENSVGKVYVVPDNIRMGIQVMARWICCSFSFQKC